MRSKLLNSTWLREGPQALHHTRSEAEGLWGQPGEARSRNLLTCYYDEPVKNWTD